RVTSIMAGSGRVKPNDRPEPHPMPVSEQKWMDHLAIVRHAESERNVRRLAAHKTGGLEDGSGVRGMDVSPTKRGEQQAEITGHYLAKRFKFDRVFVSPYLRALQTAHLMLKPFTHRSRLTHEERIREKEFGILDGLTRQGIIKKYPDEWTRREREG